MKTIAVVGLGIMGHGIADNFLKNGYQVVVWNRSKDKAADLIDKGAVFAESVKEAVKNAEIVIEVTANDESSKQIWLGDEGILSAATPEQTLIACATLSIEWTEELAKKCADTGLSFFDMPMTGSRIGAEAGELTLLVGGDESELEAIQEDLEAIASELKYFGKAGSGMKFKLLLNSLQAIHATGFGEMLKIAREVGLDEKLVGDALSEKPGGVTTKFAWRDYQKEPIPINFSTEWVNKDLGYALDMSKNVNHPLLDDAKSLYQKAVDDGHGQDDWTMINKL